MADDDDQTTPAGIPGQLTTGLTPEPDPEPDDGPRRGYAAGTRTPGICHECGIEVPGRRTTCDDHRAKGPAKAGTDGTPRSRRGKAKARNAGKVDPPTVVLPADLEGQLRTALELMGDMFGMMTGDTICAGAIKQNAATMAAAWSGVAHQNRTVGKFLAGATASSGWVSVVAATAPVVLTVYVHHVVMPRQADAGHVHAEAPPMAYGPTDDQAGEVVTVWRQDPDSADPPPDGWIEVEPGVYAAPEGWTPPDPFTSGGMADPAAAGFQPVE